jgi:hypothetical protein
MRSARLSVFASLSLAVALGGGCTNARTTGDEGDPNQPPVVKGEQSGPLTILPGSPAITVDGKSPYRLDFKVLRNNEDVTDRVSLSLDNPGFGTFAGGTLNGSPGVSGKTLVRARLGEDTGATPLSVRLETIVIAPGTPIDAPGKFGGFNYPKRAPEVAYPPANALMPPNINLLEFQWLPGEASLFELRLAGDSIDLKIYTKCNKLGDGCSFLPDEPTMKLLTQASRSRSVELTMRGSAENGGGVGTSATQKLSFSDSDMKGGLYYWAASIGGIARYDFGLRGKSAESYYDPFRAGLVVCVGCHAMSRNGQRIAVGMNIPGPAQMRTLETSTRAKLFEVGTGLLSGSNYQAFSPEGKWLVTTETAGLTLRDGTLGTVIGNNPSVANANMPDFSPDGKSVVFARSAMWCPFGPCTLSTTGASLYTVEFKGMDGFGTPQLLVQSDGANNYYPSFSPDGRFVAYNKAAGDSYDAKDAQVWVVPAKGGTPINLASVNDIVGNSWPKWSPFVHRFGSSSILWLTYSSRRTYGLHANTTAQIWMVPVDIAKLEKGEASTYPPFWLPFQDLRTGNHIPAWVEKVDRLPCTVEEEGKVCSAGERCISGYCTPVIQ